MRGILLAASCALLAACGAVAMPKFLTPSTDVEVREVARSLYCNSPGEDAAVELLADAQAVMAWQQARGVGLAGNESIVPSAYALVEMGNRPTGGYGLAVARRAVLRGETLTLQATFVSPPAGSLRTQALSSPCVLVQLPKGRYTTVEVQDPAGELRARWPRPAGEAPTAPAQ